jgi:DNA mismatch endonuclease (patch repair protein)
MADTRTKEQRRRIMQAVKGKDTGPEWTVRRLLHSLGYRYRLHPRELPGKPDIVFSRRKKAIFVHGCFWHSHGCSIGQPPKSRLDYWLPKLHANKARDQHKAAQLAAMGWSVLTVWQCETKDQEALQEKLVTFVDGSEKKSIDIEDQIR